MRSEPVPYRSMTITCGGADEAPRGHQVTAYPPDEIGGALISLADDDGREMLHLSPAEALALANALLAASQMVRQRPGTPPLSPYRQPVQVGFWDWDSPRILFRLDHEKLESVLLKKRLSSRELAERLELKEHSVQQLFRNARRGQRARCQTIKRLAQALGVGPAEIAAA